MKSKKRLNWACALLLAGLAAAEVLRVKWGNTARPGDAQPAADDPVRLEDIVYKREVADRRMEGKNQVTRDLIAGRITLPEAAARFKVLNETPADCPFNYENKAEGNSEGERLCRQVINWAVTEVAQTSEAQAQALSQRLEAELQVHLRRDGTVWLPAP
jgi:hypothetical protein